MVKFVKFVHTFRGDAWYYNNRKNPPIHYIVFATPHKNEIPSPKKTAYPAVFFTV